MSSSAKQSKQIATAKTTPSKPATETSPAQDMGGHEPTATLEQIAAVLASVTDTLSVISSALAALQTSHDALAQENADLKTLVKAQMDATARSEVEFVSKIEALNLAVSAISVVRKAPSKAAAAIGVDGAPVTKPRSIEKRFKDRRVYFRNLYKDDPAFRNWVAEKLGSTFGSHVIPVSKPKKGVTQEQHTITEMANVAWILIGDKNGKFDNVAEEYTRDYYNPAKQSFLASSEGEGEVVDEEVERE